MEKVNHPAVVKAARKLRIEIHSFEKGTGCQGADNPANSKWLDRVTVDDAEIIERETKYSRLVEAATEFVSTPCETTGLEDMEPGCCRACRLRSVLAEIKDLGIGPRLRS